MSRDSFVLYTAIAEIVERLSDIQKGQLFQAILDFERDKEINISDHIVEIAFIPIKQSLIANNEKWEKTIKARSEAGKRSAEIRKQKTTNLTNVDFVQTKVNKNEQTPTKSTVYEYVNVNVNDNEVIGKKRKRFIPPTLEEVKKYCIERNNSVDPQRFIDFYSSKGWMVGKNKMKDWKASVRTWERERKDQIDERTYDFDDLTKRFAKN